MKSDDDPSKIEDEAEAQRLAEQSLREYGFLSPFIDKFVPHFREMDREWMDYSDALNHCGQMMAMTNDGVVVGRTSLDSISLGYRILLRALGAFQGAVILAKRGMTQESHTLTRGVYESGFWLGYLANDGFTAVSAMVADEKRSQNAYFKILRKDVLAAKDHQKSWLWTLKSRQLLTEKCKILTNWPSYLGSQGFIEPTRRSASRMPIHP
jgi:hypothetical protein